MYCILLSASLNYTKFAFCIIATEIAEKYNRMYFTLFCAKCQADEKNRRSDRRFFGKILLFGRLAAAQMPL